MDTTIRGRLDRMEVLATGWMARHAITLLRISLGVVFFWFGVLKFFPGLSPAEDHAARTISVLTFGRMGPSVSLPVLATWETAIGLLFITGWFTRVAVGLLFAQMAGTFLPLAFFPAEAWTRAPFAATLEGQYIIKNVVLISAGLVVGATIRGYALAPAGAGAPARVRLPVLPEGAAVLCATPEAHCRAVRVDTGSLPASLRGAYLQVQKGHARA
jgi:uncharacterized membrane protein YphA (DoxX/SURF4 family)